MQDPQAIGAHGNTKGEPEFPEIAVYTMDETDLEYLDDYYGMPDGNVYNFGYQDLIINSFSTRPAPIYYILERYELELKKQNIDIQDITLLTVSDINKIVKQSTNKELPLQEWYNDRDNWGDYNIPGSDYSYIVGSIKENISSEYSWLWSTTYWTRTYEIGSDWSLYFVDTLGNLCSGNMCDDVLGAGIRPVITMSVEELEYQIETKTDGKGTIEVNTSAGNGEEVQVTITPKKGYELKEVQVTDAEGNILTFTDYTFIMPSSNVTIEAIFEVKNPNTSATNITILILLGMCSIFAMKKHIKRINWLTN